MPISEALLPEFDQEMANTRKTLERIPDDKLGWKPHEKSGTMGWVAGHLANIPSWALSAIQEEVLDIAPPGGPAFQLPNPKTRQEILDLFDKNVTAARKAIAGANDAHLAKTWSLQKAGQTIMSMPRTAVLRTWVMNHSIHHRAQLGVYLRLNNIAVPALYGPSADEGAM